MKIDYVQKRYYDQDGEEIRSGDIVSMDGRMWEVMETEDGYLGVDSTNPKWIERGWAAAGEYGIYEFTEADEPYIMLRDLRTEVQ